MRIASFTLLGISLITLTACSQEPIKEEQTVSLPTTAPSSSSEQLPPLAEIKNGKTLNMVRIMDGAACKNEYQGVKGTFLVYANPEDIERIKREKSTKIFADFEIQIQSLASEALQKATETTNLAEDPFALGADQARQNLANQLSANFQHAIEPGLNHFFQESTLLIDIHPFAPSLTFYQTGCDASELEPDQQLAP